MFGVRILPALDHFKNGNELFLAKKGRSHQWFFCAWRRKRWLHFEMWKKSNKWKNGKPSFANFNPRLECMDGFDVHFDKFSAEIDRDRDTTLTIASPATHRRDHDQRAEHRHYDGSVTTQGIVSTLGKLRQNVGNRMVLTYNDVGHTPKCPQIGVLLNNRVTNLPSFLLYKFGVR